MNTQRKKRKEVQVFKPKQSTRLIAYKFVTKKSKNKYFVVGESLAKVYQKLFQLTEEEYEKSNTNLGHYKCVINQLPVFNNLSPLGVLEKIAKDVSEKGTQVFEL